MPIATITLSPLRTSDVRQVGTFVTSAAADLSTTTVGTTAINSTFMNVASSAGIDADYISIPGGGTSGGTIALPALAATSATQLTLYPVSLVTAVPAGTTITRWNKIMLKGRPRRLQFSNRTTGDRYEWTEGMDVFTLKQYSGAGVYTLLSTFAIVVQAGAINIGPGILAASATYDIQIDY